MVQRLILIGLSGSGKSSVGALAANSLGWSFIDVDEEIERSTGRTIASIFGDDGEPAFRKIESVEMRRALGIESVVIATGGGAVLDPAIWDESGLGSADCLVVWLDASPEELARRLQRQSSESGQSAVRPLLGTGDVLARITDMRSSRLPNYERATVTVPVDGRSPEAIAEDLRELTSLANGIPSEIALDVKSAASRIRVGNGARWQLPAVISETWSKAQHVFVVVDANVRPHVAAYLDDVAPRLTAAMTVIEVAPGESSKSLDGAGRLYDAMLGEGIERGDVVVALGGGVVGDLAGFAAATVLRGVGLVQIPTTLLAMVDSSVGGKTGINHPAGKNLIGAFYQPPWVLIDPELLSSLPEREYRSGWAEIIKHAVIEASTPVAQPPVLLDILERNRESLLRRDTRVLPWVVRRNVSLKAAVVAADEREQGIRAYLNFGHTIGHGVEAAGYRLLHGEAVAVGMCAALNLSVDVGTSSGIQRDRIATLLSAFGLPQTVDIDADDVRAHMAHDKKKVGGRQRWVLTMDPSGVGIRQDVPEDAVDRAIASVRAAN